MSESSGKRLMDLLPPLYRIEDESGDLQCLLDITAPTLDEIKLLIDHFPDIFDVDRCSADYLPLLSHLVGLGWDGKGDPREQRRLIKDAVPLYRRKSTIPSIRRSLIDTGWSGGIEETFRRALRLNSRPRLNASKLPGLIYSLGVYRLICHNQADGLRDALAFHHPAGTRVFFWQWFFSRVRHGADLQAWEKMLVRYVLFGSIDESFILNATPLNQCFHLTRKQRAFSVAHITASTTLQPDFDDAATCFLSWHGRGDRMRLNRRALNTRMLTNTWESERKLAVCCGVRARRRPLLPPPTMRLNEGNLGDALLNFASVPCRVRFRQKDFYDVTDRLEAREAHGHETFRRSDYANTGRGFRTNLSPLSGTDPLSGRDRTPTFVSISMAGEQWGDVTEAWNVVERWRRKGPVFNLNSDPLNGRYLTDANITAEKAAFELRIDTGYPRRRRTEPLLLNARPLNHTGLRLSVARTDPLRLGRMALNQSGPRIARPDLRWRFRQVDFHFLSEASPDMWTSLQSVN